MTDQLEIIILESTENMEKALLAMERGFIGIRSGSANPAILDRIHLDYYGAHTQLKQIASIAVIEGSQLYIKPYDVSTLRAIEQALNASDLNLPPQNDGMGIRLHLPRLTEARRKELVKEIEVIAESGKVGIRNSRRDANEQVKKASFPEDMEKRSLEQIQEMTDKYTTQIDELTKTKSQELMKI